MITKRPLFVPRILKREVFHHIARGVTPPTEAQKILAEWNKQVRNRTLSRYSETQVEAAFNAAIFEQVLGYKPLGSGPTHHIVPKRSAKTGRDIPDFVLGTFNPGNRIERWRAVGEIKSVNTNLDLPQTSRYNHETPVQQAFRYGLNGEPGVEWIIVTNFAEIRLYRNGYTGAYHSWTLDELCTADKLNEFYVLLCRQHIAPEHGQSETLRILETSLRAGLALTEGFYGLYDIARKKLTAELCKQPSFIGAPLATVFGKAHKILNRVLFAAYCEDHPAGLLPRETLKRLHHEAESLNREGSYWKVFQQFFRELDAGSPPGSPFAYNAFNGGLFAFDLSIDKLKLTNAIFTEEISYRAARHEPVSINGIFAFYEFDFAEELGVDALGAIFEQSLKDLPHFNQAVRGHGDVNVTRREATGVYYTQPAITNFMISRTLSYFLDPVKQQILEDVQNTPVKTKEKVGKRALTVDETRDVLFQRRLLDYLRNVKLIDPACGSGAFLVQALEHLHAQYEVVNAALDQLMGGSPMFGLDRFILRNNLHGIDILPESVEITRLSIWLRTALRNEPLEKLDAIRCGDSLKTTERSEYDLVVSNPPWGSTLDGWTDEMISARFPACGEEKDSYAVFLIRGYELLKPNGILAYIMPNSWLTVDSYSPLRKWISEHLEILEIINTWKIFEDVNNDTCILFARKRSPFANQKTIVAALSRGQSEAGKCQQLAQEQWSSRFEAQPANWKQEPGCRFEIIYPPRMALELNRIAKHCVPLSDIANVTVGIQVYHQRKVSADIIKNRAFHGAYKAGPNWYPYITGNQVQRYYQAPSDNAFLLYSEDLCDKRELDHYQEPRILVQQIFWNRISASLAKPTAPSLYLNTLFSITKRSDALDLEYILAILNSRFVSAAYERWTNHIFGDKFPKVSKIDLARLPIPVPTPKQMRHLNTVAGQLGSLWSQLRYTLQTFLDWVKVTDRSGKLLRNLGEFWTLDKQANLMILGEAKTFGTPREVQLYLEHWGSAVSAVNQIWGQIVPLEDEVEQIVMKLYRINESVYSDLIARVPRLDISAAMRP